MWDGLGHCSVSGNPCPAQGGNGIPDPVCSFRRPKAASQPGQAMQSTVNYLWHTDDLLGQGATASVYKARNKVGHSPGQAPSGWARSGPCQPLVGSKGGVWRGRGLAHPGAGGRYGFGKRAGELWRAPWDGASVRHSLGLEREREEDPKPSSWAGGSKCRNSGVGKWGLFGFTCLRRSSVLTGSSVWTM